MKKSKRHHDHHDHRGILAGDLSNSAVKLFLPSLFPCQFFFWLFSLYILLFDRALFIYLFIYIFLAFG